MPESKARTAQVQTAGGWQTKSLSQLASGDRFRVVKSDGSLVACQRGHTEFTAGQRAASVKPCPVSRRASVRERFAGLFTSQAPLACA